MMKTSPNGRHFIEGWEGLILHAYYDSAGVITIGYGHTTAAGPPRVYHGMVITADQADQILSTDLAGVENDVNRLVHVPINQNQFDALVSFHFNTGALARANVLRAVNAGLFKAVPADLMMWDHAHVHGQLVVLDGLARRRKAEGALFAMAPPVNLRTYRELVDADRNDRTARTSARVQSRRNVGAKRKSRA
jgi:lysozyme